MEDLEFKGTKGEWYTPHISNDEATCDCPFVLCDSLWSSIGTVKVMRLQVLPKEEIGTSFENEYPTLEEAKANGKLIAAAPDLLEALQECMGELYSIHSQYGDKRNARDHSYALTISEKAIERALK